MITSEDLLSRLWEDLIMRNDAPKVLREIQDDLFTGASSKQILDHAIKKGATQRGAILRYIRSCGQTGTCQDLMLIAFPEKPYSTVTAAPAALLKAGLIYRRGDVMNGRSGRKQKILRIERRQYPNYVIDERREYPPDFDELTEEDEDPEISDPLEVRTDTPGNIDPHW